MDFDSIAIIGTRRRGILSHKKREYVLVCGKALKKGEWVQVDKEEADYVGHPAYTPPTWYVEEAKHLTLNANFTNYTVQKVQVRENEAGSLIAIKLL